MEAARGEHATQALPLVPPPVSQILEPLMIRIPLPKGHSGEDVPMEVDEGPEVSAEITG